MIWWFPLTMLKCLTLTIIIECLLAFILKIRKKDLLFVLLVNILTNPIVVSVSLYVNIMYGLHDRNIILAILEILVLLVEGFIYYKCLDNKKINPFVLSLILNGTSFLLGEVINRVF